MTSTSRIKVTEAAPSTNGKAKKQRKIVDMYIYRKSQSSSQAYMSNEMPRYNTKRNQLESDGSEVDICEYGIATFGIDKNKDLQFGRVIRVRVAVLNIDAATYSTKINLSEFGDANLSDSVDFETLRRQRMRVQNRNDSEEEEIEDDC